MTHQETETAGPAISIESSENPGNTWPDFIIWARCRDREDLRFVLRFLRCSAGAPVRLRVIFYRGGRESSHTFFRPWRFEWQPPESLPQALRELREWSPSAAAQIGGDLRTISIARADGHHALARRLFDETRTRLMLAHQRHYLPF